LESWKDIAAYLRRTVRTTQRWEQTEGLPVHRHPHEKRGSVYAYPSELDVWWQERQARLALEERRFDDPIPPPAVPRSRSFAGGCADALAELAAAARARLRRPALSLSRRDCLLVTDFNNRTGEAALDSSLSTAFRISLEQSRRVNLLRGARLQAVLRSLDKPGDVRIDEPLGREICVREGAKGLITCGIARTGRQYALLARLIEPQSGATLRSHVVRAEDQSLILTSLEELASAIRKDLR
jgi:hypothetical protein